MNREHPSLEEQQSALVRRRRRRTQPISQLLENDRNCDEHSGLPEAGNSLSFETLPAEEKAASYAPVQTDDPGAEQEALQYLPIDFAQQSWQTQQPQAEDGYCFEDSAMQTEDARFLYKQKPGNKPSFAKTGHRRQEENSFSFVSFKDHSAENNRVEALSASRSSPRKPRPIPSNRASKKPKKKRRLILVAAAAALIVALVLAVLLRAPKWEPDQQMENVFAALRGRLPDTPVILDVFGNRATIHQTEGPAKWVAERAEYTILSQRRKGDWGEVELRIRVPDAIKAIYASVEGMRRFDQQAFEQRFADALTQQPEMIEYDVTVEMALIDGTWYLVGNSSFANAVTGGMLTAHAELETAVKEALLGGETQ